MSVDPSDLRRVLGTFLTGVTIVTTRTSAGEAVGITANSFSSVSLDPPLVLFSIMKTSSNCAAFAESRGFNIHILGAHNEQLARTFASKPRDERFLDIPTTDMATGAPLLTNVGSWLACHTWKVVDAGDHLILIGEVYACEAVDERPLGFFQSRFNTFQLEEELVQNVADQAGLVDVGWVLEAPDGRVLLTKQDGGYALPHTTVHASQLTESRIAALAGAAVGRGVAVDLLFSLYESPSGHLTLIYRGSASGAADDVDSGSLVAVSGDEVPNLPMKDKAERGVIQRYLRERQDAQFGIYTGSRDDGVVASVSGVQRDWNDGSAPPQDSSPLFLATKEKR